MLVGLFGLALRHLAGRRTSARFGFGCPVSSLLALLSCHFVHTVNETLKWLTPQSVNAEPVYGGDSGIALGGLDPSSSAIAP